MPEPKYVTDKGRTPAPPAYIKHAEMIEALQPLLDLCGVDAMSVYGDPGVIITSNGVRLTVAAGPDDADKRPSSDDSHAEWVRDIEIPTDIGLAESHV